MANLSGYPSVFAGDTSVVDSSAQYALGTRAVDGDGNEYIYMLGVASTIVGSAVTYDEAYTTTLTAANAVGPVAVAMAAIVASSYGWYCVKGTCTLAVADAVADNKALYLTATAGKLDDADVAGDAIVGIWSRGTTSGAGTLTAQLDYPKAHDIAFD